MRAAQTISFSKTFISIINHHNILGIAASLGWLVFTTFSAYSIVQFLFHGKAIEINGNNFKLGGFFKNSLYQYTVCRWCKRCWAGKVLKYLDGSTSMLPLLAY